MFSEINISYTFTKMWKIFSFFVSPSVLNYLASYPIHPATYLPIDSSPPPLVLSKLTTPPSSDSSKWNQWKVSMFPLDVNIIFTAPWDISTLASFLRGGTMTTSPVKSPPVQYPHAPLQIKRWNLLLSKYPFNGTNSKEKCHKCQGNGQTVKILLWNLFCTFEIPMMTIELGFQIFQ